MDELNKNCESNVYSESDTSTAAYLKVKGLPMVGVRHEGKKAFFLFRDPELAERLKNEMHCDGGEIPALAYKDALRNLTTLANNR